MKKLLIFIFSFFVFTKVHTLPEIDKKKEPTKDRWIKVFGKAKFPSHDCKYCMQTHAHWAYNNYRTGSLKNRETKNNGGLKKIIIQPAKKTIRPIKKNIKPLPKEIYNYVYYRDISSLMIFDKGILIHDWKRDYIFNNKPINGESRSKSIVGVAALKMSCQGILDLKKTHRYYSPKIKDSYYGHITLEDSLNMLARDQYVITYNALSEMQNKKSDLVSILNKHPKKFE